MTKVTYRRKQLVGCLLTVSEVSHDYQGRKQCDGRQADGQPACRQTRLSNSS